MVSNDDCKFLNWNEEQRETILNKFNRNSNNIQIDIDIIKRWLAQQPHLPKLKEVITDNVIEFFLIYNKFRMEIIKQRLDMYFSIRPHYPQFFDVKDYTNILSSLNLAILKNLTTNYQRIYVIKFKTKDATNFNPYEMAAYALYVAETRIRTDRALSDIYILDFEKTSFDHIVKFTPMFIKHMLIILEKMFSSRFDGIYMINSPKFIDTFINLIKSIIKDKLKDRVKSFQDANVLFELLPKSDIPKDYGGDAETIQELSDKLTKKCKEINHLLDIIKKNPVNEKLRPGKPLDVDFYGTEGTFRQLQID